MDKDADKDKDKDKERRINNMIIGFIGVTVVLIIGLFLYF